MKFRVFSLVPCSPGTVQNHSSWAPGLHIKEDKKCGQLRQCWRGRLEAKRGRGYRDIVLGSRDCGRS